MKFIKQIIATVLIVAMAISFGACSSKSIKTISGVNTSPDKNITVSLEWTPNTNHTGMYVALQKGYYKAAGLNVKIVQPPEDDAITACSSGQVQFAVGCQDLLAPAFSGEMPMDVTAVAAIIQHNSSCIISSKGTGMTTPKGMEGKEYLTWQSPIELAILKNVVESDGGNWRKVKQIPNTVTNEAEDIKANPNHAIWTYYGWGVINANLTNAYIDCFSLRDINPVFDYYTPVIVANNDFLEEYGDTVRAFLQATRKGYEYSIENPEDAARILIDSDETKSLVGSEKLVIESQKWMAANYIADASQWGYINPQRWNSFYNWLNEEGLTEHPIKENTGFTNDYLN